MIIREQDLRKPVVLTEQEIKHAQKLIDQWEAVKSVMESPGWKVLIEYFESQLQTFDSLSNTELDDFLYRKGLVDGLKRLLQSPKQLKQNATSAAKYLRAGLAENEE